LGWKREGIVFLRKHFENIRFEDGGDGKKNEVSY
jgi:hypothetical protein